MATTRLIALHITKGGTIESALKRSTDYVENEDKTNGGDLVLSYQCDPLTAHQEFTLAKRNYAIQTGREQGKRDVIAYHLRQSFKPGETDTETAGKIAWETVMALTKGKHAFVIAVHTDRAHIHAHTVFNSTSLDCMRKWRNFHRSAYAVRRISDTLCLTHGLSIVEKPKGRGQSYDKWLGNNKPLGNREQLVYVIDSVLPNCKTWKDFIAELKSLGCEVKQQNVNVSIKLPEAKRFARLSSLPAGYDEKSIRARLSGEIKFDATPLRETGAKVPQLLIDIQQKLQDGYGAGYEHWARVENLKRSAKTLIYIQESGIDSYEELEQKCSAAASDVAVLQSKIKDIENKQAAINKLQEQIGNYGKSFSVYKEYNAIKNPKRKQEFYEAHRPAIERHRMAKKYFDELGYGRGNKKKLPSINMLKEEWAALEKERRPFHAKYKTANQKFKDLVTAKSNAHRMLGPDKQRNTSRGHGAEI